MEIVYWRNIEVNLQTYSIHELDIRLRQTSAREEPITLSDLMTMLMARALSEKICFFGASARKIVVQYDATVAFK